MRSSAVAILLALIPGTQDDERIQKLIQAFGDSSKDERNRAVEELAKIGRPALEALRKAATSSDLEVKGLAAQAIEKIEWLGLDRLRRYVKESFDENATVELSKIKGLSRWLPETRLYEVSGAAGGGGPGAMMGMPAPRSLFAVRKYEDGFQRLLVKGVYSAASMNALVQKSKIVIADDEAALDFVIAYLELQSAGSNQNPAAMMMGGPSRLERTADGWTLTSGMYGPNVHFKTGRDGVLTEIVQKAANFNFGMGGAGDAGGDDRAKLEIEKLKLEIDLLKRQLDRK